MNTPLIETWARERPILFSGPMVRAILADSKWQTRRVCKPAWNGEAWAASVHSDGAGTGWIAWWHDPVSAEDTRRAYPGEHGFPCPYGRVGDRLWVRETFITGWSVGDGGDLEQFDEDGHELPRTVWYRASTPELTWLSDDGDQTANPPWKPSIHMPRWASRILLELTDIRVQPLGEMLEADGVAEGFTAWTHRTEGTITAFRQFRELWQTINGAKYPWDRRIQTWVLSFRRIAGESK